MSANLLHKNKLEEFIQWLSLQGIETKKGKGVYQVLLVRVSPKVWCGVYERDNSPEHYSTDRRLDFLVVRFIKDSRI